MARTTRFCTSGSIVSRGQHRPGRTNNRCVEPNVPLENPPATAAVSADRRGASVTAGPRRAPSMPRGASPHRRNRLARQPVGPLVDVVTAVAAHPVPAHAVLRQRRIEPLPLIVIPDRLLVG